MDPLLIAMFVLGGVGVAFLLGAFGLLPKSTPRPQPRFPRKDKLDTIDEMFLWGEVNRDDSYRM
tara:strand:- start:1657 stop:1848 length:192 start_codon:yes stop_codon:yes gene_type:complete